MRYTRANALKQLAFFHAEHPKCFFPKILNVARKAPFYDFIMLEAEHFWLLPQVQRALSEAVLERSAPQTFPVSQGCIK